MARATGSMNGPCPICGEPGGFHADQPHQEARDRIPRELIKPKGWQLN